MAKRAMQISPAAKANRRSDDEFLIDIKKLKPLVAIKLV